MIDKLIEKIDGMKNPTVVGLDPKPKYIPEHILKKNEEKYGKTLKAMSMAYLEFNKDLIDSLYDIVPAIKPQIAMYECLGVDGIDCYIKTIQYAREKGMIVIGDIKRGDISSTAKAYASHIGGTKVYGKEFDVWKEDFITVNPYFGVDGIGPFIEEADKKDRGIFVLVKTSNKSSYEIQNLVVDGEHIYERVARLVNDWGSNSIGKYGYSRVGAVVGATFVKEGERIRKLLPKTFFLIPGYGAQGGKGETLKPFFDKKGRGGIVNSSRGIITAYKKMNLSGKDAHKEGAREAALIMRDDLRKNIYNLNKED